MNKFSVLQVTDFSHIPFQPEDIVELRCFGVGVVGKIQTKNWLCEGPRTIYRFWEPIATRLCKGPDDLIGRHLELQDNLEKPDGTLFQKCGQEHMWPIGVAAQPLRPKLHRLYSKIRHERVREICNIVFPESKSAIIGDNGDLVVFTDGPLSTDDLDDITKAKKPLTPYVGWKVYHNMFGTGRLLELKSGRFVCQWRTICPREGCSRRFTYLTMSGCHHGAWCYVCDKDGKYQADLRNQYLICSKCSKLKKRLAKNEG